MPHILTYWLSKIKWVCREDVPAAIIGLEGWKGVSVFATQISLPPIAAKKDGCYNTPPLENNVKCTAAVHVGWRRTKEKNMNLTRKSFLELSSLAALAGCRGFCQCGDKGSVYKGIPIGVITYSYRSMQAGAGKTLAYVLDSKLSTIELMSNDVEIDAGAPMNKLSWKMSKEEKAALAAWRLNADMKRYEDVRAKYAAAGVEVHIVKFGDIGAKGLSDAEMDYRFKVARAMGADTITREIPDPKNIPGWWEAEGKRLAAFAEKWDTNIAFHNHLQINATTYDGPLLGYSKKFMINYDIGHFTAANDTDPLDMVRKYHDRIVSIHIKDRTTKAHGQKNLPFGTGDTPLTGLFALMLKEGWTFPCDIELEYEIPKSSNAVKEVGICNDFCRNGIERC